MRSTRQPDFSLPSILAHLGLHDCRHRNMVIGRHQLGPSCGSLDQVGFTPLIDLGAGFHQGEQGGLYPSEAITYL